MWTRPWTHRQGLPEQQLSVGNQSSRCRHGELLEPASVVCGSAHYTRHQEVHHLISNKKTFPAEFRTSRSMAVCCIQTACKQGYVHDRTSATKVDTVESAPQKPVLMAYSTIAGQYPRCPALWLAPCKRTSASKTPQPFMIGKISAGRCTDMYPCRACTS